MTLNLRGNAWYLRKTIKVNGKSKVRDFPLKVRGADPCCQPPKKRAVGVEPCTNDKPCKFRRKALTAARMLADDVDRKNAAAGVNKEFGIEQQRAKKDVPTLRQWWGRVKEFYDVEHHPRIERWLAFPFQQRRTWGDAPLDEIQKSDCLAALTTRRKQHRRSRGGAVMTATVSEGTVQKERGYIQAILQRAVDDQILDRNPWTGIDKPMDNVGRRHEDGTVRLLTEADEPKLLAELRPREQRWVRFVLATGVRKEGALELRAEHVRLIGTDWFAHVGEKSKDHNYVCPVCKRKGKKCREVPLTTAAKTIIDEQIAADGQLWHGLPRMASITRTLAEATTAADIGLISPHDLRHTFGWRWIQRGGARALGSLSRMLGHKSEALTRRVYAHCLPNDLADMVREIMEPKQDEPDEPEPESRQPGLHLVKSA